MPAEWLMLYSLLSIGGANAATDDAQAPSPEMLEFLGTWETEAGKWIDPEQLPGQPGDTTTDAGTRPEDDKHD